MRILTHPLHTGYDFELSKTGHQFFSANALWDYGQRPKPENWNLIGDPTGDYDLAIAGGFEFFRRIKGFRLPIVWITHADMTSGQFPEEIEQRISKVVFSSSDVAGRNFLRDSSKKQVIEHSIDSKVYKEYTGIVARVLCVSNCMTGRPEKRLDRMLEIGRHVALDLLGAGNEGVRGAIGNANDYVNLLRRYREYRAFINPSDIVSTSLLEAMGTGVPIVSFDPINFKDLIQDGINGFLVKDVPQAIDRIRLLLNDAPLCHRIGRLGRDSVIRRFNPELFQARWNRLFESVLAGYRK